MGLGDIISWIVVGLIAGAIAKFLLPGKDPGGCIITIVIGIVGSVLAAWLAHLLKIADETKEISLTDRGFWMKVGFGIVGAVIILAAYRLIAGKRA
jgi:uncharacterized membrane protein YeaQ/YmgE (transglycosylase-associated protein family)